MVVCLSVALVWTEVLSMVYSTSCLLKAGVAPNLLPSLPSDHEEEDEANIESGWIERSFCCKVSSCFCLLHSLFSYLWFDFSP